MANDYAKELREARKGAITTKPVKIPPTATSSKLRTRVKELRMVRASDLRRNPKNWRDHPENQRSALHAIFDTIGFSGAIITRVLPDGALEIIDGHLRQDESGDNDVPVLVTDLTEQEADLLLATYDPIAAMAETNDGMLRELLDGLQSSISSEHFESLNDMLSSFTSGESFQFPTGGIDVEEKLAQSSTPPSAKMTGGGTVKEVEHVCPKCGHAFAS